jgi:para-nitrobenzyl esterase
MNGNPAFLYHFSHPYAVPIAGLGAFHSAELPFVWGNPYLLSKLKAAELPLSQAMQGYWTRFATTGDPNGGAPAGAAAWPGYAPASDSHLTLDLTIAAGAGLRKATCDWMDSAIP